MAALMAILNDGAVYIYGTNNRSVWPPLKTVLYIDFTNFIHGRLIDTCKS